MGEYLAEIGLIGICWRKNRLGGVCAGADVVVMLGKSEPLPGREETRKKTIGRITTIDDHRRLQNTLQDT